MLDKVCGTCKQVKPVGDFRKNCKQKDGLQYRCKTCLKEWFLNRRKRSRRLINSMKSRKGCLQCGDKRYFVLDYHHMDPSTKLCDVSLMLKKGYALRTVKNEIEKCILLCSNCHREAHYIQKRLRLKRKTQSGQNLSQA